MVANDHATHLHFCLSKCNLDNRRGLSQSLAGKQKPLQMPLSFARDYLTGGSGDCAGANGAFAGYWINNRKAVGKLNLAGERKINSDEFIVLKALFKCNIY
jgi:hypothetical protein